jgi:hypothetical protein
LLATYASSFGAPHIAVSDAMLTMLPRPESRRCGSAAVLISQVPRTLTFMTASHVSTDNSSANLPPELVIAALLISASSPPSCAAA